MTTSQSQAGFRVAICGGGIGGICLALLLSKIPHIQVELFEATSRFKEIGAGVMIWSRTWRILELMGLAPHFSQIAHAPPDGSLSVGFDYRRSDAPKKGFRFRLVEMPYGCIRFHRAEFLDVFVDHLPGGIAHFGKRLTSYSQTEPNGLVTLQFSDGTSSVCHLLVGCDGIKSSIRAQMFRDKAGRENLPDLLRHVEPVFTGTIAYRGLVKVEDILKAGNGASRHRTTETPMMYCGKSKHVVSYSISKGNVVNVVTFASQPERHGSQFDGEWVTECPQQELLDCYAGWEDEVSDLLNCIKQPTRWAIHHLNPLPFYFSGQVMLMGDAAHAMSPHQGAGAGQAIEDAYVLARLLAITSKRHISAALSAYESIRLPIANSVLKGSYESGMMYEFNSKFGQDYSKLGPAIEDQWKWIRQNTPDEDAEHAISIYKQNAEISHL